MITVCDLSKSFGKNKILDSLSFHIGKGEVVGLLGENGAGKTTLFRLLSGLLKQDSGSIVCSNHQADKAPAKLLSVFFGGTSRLYDRLSAKENIWYFAQLHGMKSAHFHERLNELAQALDMERYLNRKTEHFSHGMKQKTALVRMIINDPSILLLDEPTTGMDVPAIESVLRFVKSLRSTGKTLLYSSHNIYELARVCEYILILHKGRIQKKIQVVDASEASLQSIEEEYLKIIR